ncbi:SCO family protein [Mesobacterium sp. TK19101]|uniref:SCO family protein n=1 Tax=Mesobacterium hydrothermale TaxID=3111907 RepID=A0ABU6HIE5_9RHOB|nr:SCO family protein [Mesobacterium sp. TK19101]MEC3861594.1 SCO family protein [Mesobacterium sp. TK19101]
MVKFAAIAGAVAVAALLGGVWYVSRPAPDADRFAQCRTGKIAGGSETIGGPFTLVNAAGKTVTDKDVITGPTLLYFGYTYCPDVCPLDNARNVEAVDILEDRGVMVTPVFISIDPKRDTPEVVGDFAQNMHERMIGLTGSPEQVKAASQAYRTYFKVQDPDEEYYLVDHSTFTYLVFPEYGFVEFFRRELTPEQMADKVACFVEKS